MIQTLARPAPAVPPLTTVSRAVLRAQWTKLRTGRSTMWALLLTVVAIVGLGALLTAIEVSRWDTRPLAEVNGFDPLHYSFAGTNLAQLSTFSAVVAVVAVVSVVSCISALFLCQVLLAPEHAGVSITDPGVLRRARRCGAPGPDRRDHGGQWRCPCGVPRGPWPRSSRSCSSCRV